MSQRSLIDISTICQIPPRYPMEFIDFCKKHELRPPRITSMNGKALAAMLDNPRHYWNRETCDQFIKKFNIKTKDSIQLFNKHSQWGIKTNSGSEKGKLFIQYPYELSNKYNLRRNFTYNGTAAERNTEIEKIKSTIIHDYVNVPNSEWQLGHKNPASPNSGDDKNMVLQPPIQGKYRDNYIFIDTLTKVPLPAKMRAMIKKKELEFTAEQVRDYRELFSSLEREIS